MHSTANTVFSHTRVFEWMLPFKCLQMFLFSLSQIFTEHLCFIPDYKTPSSNLLPSSAFGHNSFCRQIVERQRLGHITNIKVRGQGQKELGEKNRWRSCKLGGAASVWEVLGFFFFFVWFVCFVLFFFFFCEAESS